MEDENNLTGKQPNPLQRKLYDGLAYLRGEHSMNQSTTGINNVIRLAKIAQKNYEKWVECHFMELGCSPGDAFDAIRESNLGANGYGVFIGELVQMRSRLKKVNKKPKPVIVDPQDKIREGVAYLEEDFESNKDNVEGLVDLMATAQLARRGFSLWAQQEYHEGKVRKKDLIGALEGLYGLGGNEHSRFIGKVNERIWQLVGASAAQEEDEKYGFR